MSNGVVIDGELSLRNNVDGLPNEQVVVNINGASKITDKVSGAIASFPDGADNEKLLWLKFGINPQQDLHGYSYPWPGGGGYNILPDGNTLGKLNDAGLTVTLTDTTLSGYTATKVAVTGTAASWGWRIYTSGIRSVLQPGTAYKITFLASAAYTFVGMIATTGSASKLCENINFTRTQLSNGLYEYAGTFTTYASTDAGWSANNQVLLLYLNPATTSPVDFTIVNGICLTASTAPDGYYAYSNICPISGWSQVDAVAAGGNLFDFSAFYPSATKQRCTVTQAADGKLIATATATGGMWVGLSTAVGGTIPANTFTIPARAGMTFATSFTATGFYEIDASGKVLKNKTQNDGVYTVTEAACAKLGFRINFGSASSVGQEVSGYFCLVPGSTAPSLQTPTPTYSGTPITISLGQTVYGGTVDAIAGKLVIDRVGVAITNANEIGANHYAPIWRINYNNATSTAKAPASTSVTNIMCNAFKAVGEVNRGQPGTCFISGSSKWIQFDFSDTGIADTNAAKTYFLSLNPFIVYELATPIEVDLTPVSVNSLLGQNNIWCNTGDTEVEYVADTKLYIEKLTQPTEDDMIANNNIASGKYFMIGNALYLSTAAISAGETIKPGTNCTLTNLAAALNAINS